MTVEMTGVLCAKSHEYVVKKGDLLTIGITDFAAEQLGDIVFVELPEVGTILKQEEVFGTIESVKAASEMYMPVSGRVVEINDKVVDAPELVNTDSFGDGWLMKISDFNNEELAGMMSYEEYKAYLEKEQ